MLRAQKTLLSRTCLEKCQKAEAISPFVRLLCGYPQRKPDERVYKKMRLLDYGDVDECECMVRKENKGGWGESLNSARWSTLWLPRSQRLAR